jgi:hypothetical protein
MFDGRGSFVLKRRAEPWSAMCHRIELAIRWVWLGTFVVAAHPSIGFSFILPGETIGLSGASPYQRGEKLSPRRLMSGFSYFAILESFAAWTKAEQKASTFLSTTN